MDAERRAAERRSEVSGDVADRARLLQARLRAGQLSTEHVELMAAGLGGVEVMDTSLRDVTSEPPLSTRPPRGCSRLAWGAALFGGLFFCAPGMLSSALYPRLLRSVPSPDGRLQPEVAVQPWAFHRYTPLVLVPLLLDADSPSVDVLVSVRSTGAPLPLVRTELDHVDCVSDAQRTTIEWRSDRSVRFAEPIYGRALELELGDR